MAIAIRRAPQAGPALSLGGGGGAGQGAPALPPLDSGAHIRGFGTRATPPSRLAASPGPGGSGCGAIYQASDFRSKTLHIWDP
jgi:hypothetical protein